MTGGVRESMKSETQTLGARVRFLPQMCVRAAAREMDVGVGICRPTSGDVHHAGDNVHIRRAGCLRHISLASESVVKFDGAEKEDNTARADNANPQICGTVKLRLFNGRDGPYRWGDTVSFVQSGIAQQLMFGTKNGLYFSVSINRDEFNLSMELRQNRSWVTVSLRRLRKCADTILHHNTFIPSRYKFTHRPNNHQYSLTEAKYFAPYSGGQRVAFGGRRPPASPTSLAIICECTMPGLLFHYATFANPPLRVATTCAEVLRLRSR
ncbi:hypothetical protein C8J57DRAFT_1222354 [Mycena rebaudengoi]|nr:hypothetical protein C8J57DRAFT_1222354 [Mycena rebaudengoi]